MGKIIRLSKKITNMIAAGEVISRPASIVKELLENSIDAKASKIIIEIGNGGKDFIKITDNGEGMDYTDLHLAFDRYSTSKIKSFDDLFYIKSYGFRGEALSSIASISNLEVISRTIDNDYGTKIFIKNNKIIISNNIGCSVGTTILVKDIFSSIPVRQNYLYNEKIEQAHCLMSVIRTVLPLINLKIKVIVNGKIYFYLPNCESFLQRIAIILGEKFIENSINFNIEKEKIKIKGFISNSKYTTTTSENIFFFVNKRFIKNKFLYNILMNEYKNILRKDRYPFAIIFIDIPSTEININIHPVKIEVQFKQPQNIFSLFQKIISEKLIQLIKVKNNIISNLKNKTTILTKHTFTSNDFTYFSIKKDINIINNVFSNMKYIGQYLNTFLIFIEKNGLIIIDQHAADERIIFEKLKKSYDKKDFFPKKLFSPQIFHISLLKSKNIAIFCDILNNIGFLTEEFGPKSLMIRSIPSIINLDKLNLKTIIKYIINKISTTDLDLFINNIKLNIIHDIFKFIACNLAIKANVKLDSYKINLICKELNFISFHLSKTCPHGRPIFKFFFQKEIEKFFRRL